jgi:hypothetical protein
MDTKTIKQRVLSEDMTDDELLNLLSKRKQGGSFLKTILKGFLEGYTAPVMWRITLEITLIFLVVAGIILLSYVGRIDAMTTSVLLAFVLGFLFGKIK